MPEAKDPSSDLGRSSPSVRKQQKGPGSTFSSTAECKNRLVDLRRGLIQTNYDEITVRNLSGYQKDINGILDFIDANREKDEVKNGITTDIENVIDALDNIKRKLAKIKQAKNTLPMKSIRTIADYIDEFTVLRKLYDEAIKQFR